MIMEELKSKLEKAFGSAKISSNYSNNLAIELDETQAISMLSYLKNLGYKHLALISCVDWIEDNQFELVYVLSAYMPSDDSYSEKEKLNIIVKTRISREEAKYISIIDIFENAEPYEREIHELFGIHFEGHPRLTPLFLVLKYDKPPFRKDFDTRQFVDDYFGNIPPVE